MCIDFETVVSDQNEWLKICKFVVLMGVSHKKLWENTSGVINGYSFKGTVSRDFLPLVFFVNKHLPSLLGVS